MHLLRSARWLLLALLITLVPASSHAGVFISVGFAPPVLPVYVQPDCPEPGLMWTPGYWAYGPDGYFWVPGAWVPAPYEGALWTPPYWGWSGGLYAFHDGYWGRHIGYYGGVNYGFGYGGIGFAGGEWRGHDFAYNTAVMHVNERVIHTTYVDREVVNRYTVARDSHVAYSGGPGGINHPARPEERAAEHEQHVARTSFQAQHESAARSDKSLYVKNNGGHPAHVVAERPLAAETHPAPTGNSATQQRSTPGAMQQQRSTPGATQQQHSTTPGAMQQRSAPVQQQRSAPVEQQRSAPVQQQRSAPVEQQRSAPVQQQRSAPVEQQRSAPVQQQRSAPVQQQRSAPMQQQRSAPMQQQRSAPAQQQRSAPAQQQHSAPASHSEAEPRHK